MSYDTSEQDVLLDVFATMLQGVTKDGGKKREAGLKPPWWKDASHEAAIFSHINKWKHGEVADLDSGEHPLVHAAWRCLAIAWQESAGKVDPLAVVTGSALSSRFSKPQEKPERSLYQQRWCGPVDFTVCDPPTGGVEADDVDVFGNPTTVGGFTGAAGGSTNFPGGRWGSRS